jgi:hypothetical protein
LGTSVCSVGVLVRKCTCFLSQANSFSHRYRPSVCRNSVSRARIPPSLAGQLLAFLVFIHNFEKILGITIGVSFLNTLIVKLHWIVAVLGSAVLGKQLPAEFLDTLPGGVAVAYSVIPLIAHL